MHLERAMTTRQGSAGIQLRTLWAVATAVAIGVAIAISAALVLLTINLPG